MPDDAIEPERTPHYTWEEAENIFSALVDRLDCQLIMALCQLIQFLSVIGEWERLLRCAWADCEAEFLEIPAFKAILFLALPGDVPRVKTCRHTLPPPEAAGIQRYVSPPARNTGTFPCTDESR